MDRERCAALYNAILEHGWLICGRSTDDFHHESQTWATITEPIRKKSGRAIGYLWGVVRFGESEKASWPERFPLDLLQKLAVDPKPRHQHEGA